MTDYNRQNRIMQDNPVPLAKKICCDSCGDRAPKAYWIDERTLCEECFREYALDMLDCADTDRLAELVGAEVWEE